MQVHAFAAEWLGTASHAALQDADLLALVLSRRRAGANLDDAVLGVIFDRCREDANVAEEFVAFFLSDLARLGRGTLSPGLRRFLDTGDLVQSVVGDLWPDLLELDFLSRDQFLALLAARLRWKAADQARALRSGKRREDLRVSLGDDARSPVSHGATPMTELVAEEEWEEVVIALARMPERERRLLRGHLRGTSWSELGVAEGLQPESARKAVQRALDRIRSGLHRGAEQ